MKNLFKITTISLFLFLLSCKSTFVAPSIEHNIPDTLSKPTKTALVEQTVGELPPKVAIKTPESSSTTVKLTEDTSATVKSEKAKEPIILPKNTEVILPPDTKLETIQNTPVEILPKTEIILPNGTEITIHKVNWYAILFYCVIIFGVAWYYIKTKTNDSNNDGYEDAPEIKTKRKKNK